jgi:hypothetical protein
MPLAISKLKGMTPEVETKLKARGLDDTDKFFNAVLTTTAREELAAYANVPPSTIVKSRRSSADQGHRGRLR